MLRRLAVALIALLALGCGDENVVDAGGGGSDAGPSTAELGTGEGTFEAMTEGQDLEFIRGAQGGLHFIGSVRVRGVDPGNADDLGDPRNPTTVFEILRGTERLDADGSTYVQGLDPVAGMPGHYEMVGRLVIFTTMLEADIAGDALTLTVAVTDADGVRVEDQRTVNAVRHPLNP